MFQIGWSRVVSIDFGKFPSRRCPAVTTPSPTTSIRPPRRHRPRIADSAPMTWRPSPSVRHHLLDRAPMLSSVLSKELGERVGHGRSSSGLLAGGSRGPLQTDCKATPRSSAGSYPMGGGQIVWDDDDQMSTEVGRLLRHWAGSGGPFAKPREISDAASRRSWPASGWGGRRLMGLTDSDRQWHPCRPPGLDIGSKTIKLQGLWPLRFPPFPPPELESRPEVAELPADRSAPLH